MKNLYTTKILWILLFALIGVSSACNSDEVKNLDRKEATQILEAMGYTDIIIAAIQHDSSNLGTGGPGSAWVTGIAKRDGKSVLIGGAFGEKLFYDQQNGWCSVQWGAEAKEPIINLFTKDGKKILRHSK